MSPEKSGSNGDSPDEASWLDVHVGGTLRLRRTTLGISQDQLAHALETTVARIEAMENGQLRVGVPELFVLTSTLQIPVSWFFECLSDAGPGSAQQLTSRDIAAEVRERVQLQEALNVRFEAMPLAAQRQLVTLAKRLLQRHRQG